MGQPSALINPTAVKFNATQNILRWAQSVYTNLNAGLTLALGNKSDSSGVYNTFNRTNGDGIMIRVGAAAGSEPIKWDAGTSTAAISVATLGRKPTGWIICDIDKPASVYRSAAPTTTTLTLHTSDNTCSITVWIF